MGVASTIGGLAYVAAPRIFSIILSKVKSLTSFRYGEKMDNKSYNR